MYKLRIKLAACFNTDNLYFENAKKLISKYISEDKYEIVTNNPDVVFVLTGGTEKNIIDNLGENNFILLLSTCKDNSNAAATEIMAYLNNNNLRAKNIDVTDDKNLIVLNYYYTSLNALQLLKNKKIGLIGEVSDWLIASNIAFNTINDKFGIDVETIPWSKRNDYKLKPKSDDFIQSFANTKTDLSIDATSQVYSLLKETIETHNFDAITVECFSLVVKESVTACLPLAYLNKLGIPAGCEGDMTAIVGKMFIQALLNDIPWMANIIRVNNDILSFAHCTIPMQLVKNYSILTHFETGKGTAIQGDFIADNVTIMRFNQDLTKVFIAEGKVIEHPRENYACRTQINVKISTESAKKIREKPLGNHHLIIPGHHAALLSFACNYLRMEQV